MLPLGTQAPDFTLPSTGGQDVSLDDFSESPVLVVAFICNHCPFVKHMRHKLAEVAKQYQDRGVAFVGINSNDAESHPDDSFEAMQREVEDIGYIFPYLHDEAQEVAKVYRAACTPDIFVFDAQRQLVYRGRFDDSSPGNDRPVTGQDLIDVLEAMLAGQGVDQQQSPSMGCNIKWKPGNEPEYFG